MARSTFSARPACSTGHFSVRYWPGGSRAGSSRFATFFRPGPEHALPRLIRWRPLRSRRGRARSSASGPRRSRLSPAHGLERRRGPRAGRACDALLLTPKARVIAPLRVLRRGGRRLPGADRARARRAACEATAAHALRGEMRDRAGGAHVALVWESDERRTAWLSPETSASRALRCSTRRRARRRRRGARTVPNRGGHTALGARDRRPRAPGRSRSRRAHLSFTKGCYPGQEPIARCATAAM